MDMREFKKRCGRRLQELREIIKQKSPNPKDWSQAAVAEKLGVDISNYAKWEQGVTWPHRDAHFENLCKFFGVDATYFLTTDEHYKEMKQSIAQAFDSKESALSKRIDELRTELANIATNLTDDEKLLLEGYRASRTPVRQLLLTISTGEKSYLRDIDIRLLEHTLAQLVEEFPHLIKKPSSK